MQILQSDIDKITQLVSKRFKMEVTYMTRCQRTAIDNPLKRMGLIRHRDEIREVIRESIRHATSVLMIKENLDNSCRRDINDGDALFPMALNKEYLFFTEWEALLDDEKQDEWENLRDKYLNIFEKTFRNKMKRKFIDGEEITPTKNSWNPMQ